MMILRNSLDTHQSPHFVFDYRPISGLDAAAAGAVTPYPEVC